MNSELKKKYLKYKKKLEILTYSQIQDIYKPKKTKPIKIDKNKVLKKFDCKNYVYYKNPSNRKSLEGIQTKKNSLHKFLKYNYFEAKKTPIPKSYIKSVELNKKDIEEYNCGNKKYIYPNNEKYKKIKKLLVDYKTYLTIGSYEDNIFAVYIKKYKKTNIFKVIIFKQAENKIADYDDIWTKTKLVKTYNAKQVFIGKDIRKPYKKGNSILLQLTDKKFVFIGSYIYEFTITDTIEKFHSIIGITNHPRPVLVGSKNVYLLDEEKYVNRKQLPEDVTTEGMAYVSDSYMMWDILNNESKKINNVKITEKY